MGQDFMVTAKSVSQVDDLMVVMTSLDPLGLNKTKIINPYAFQSPVACLGVDLLIHFGIWSHLEPVHLAFSQNTCLIHTSGLAFALSARLLSSVGGIVKCAR